jgi:hypothetical protein
VLQTSEDSKNIDMPMLKALAKKKKKKLNPTCQINYKRALSFDYLRYPFLLPVSVFVAALGLRAKAPPEERAPLGLQSRAAVGHDWLRRLGEALREGRVGHEGHVGGLLREGRGSREAAGVAEVGEEKESQRE